MCGIVGFVQNTTNRKFYTERARELKDLMQQGLLVDMLRGMDATGMARVLHDKLKAPADVFKKGLNAVDYLQLKRADSMLDGLAEASIFIGHNRSSTRGSAYADRNAHPFQVDHITLVHNGTLNSYNGLSRRAPAEVDSAYIAAAFADGEADEVLPRLEGSFTLVWHDARDGSFHIARNKDRPMWWIHLGTEEAPWETMIYGSEIGMLAWILARNAVPSYGKYRTMLPNQHMVIHPDKVMEPVITTFEPRPAWQDRYRGGYNPHFPPGGGGAASLPPPSSPVNRTMPPTGTSPSASGGGNSTESPRSSTPAAESPSVGTKTSTKLTRKEQKGAKRLAELGLAFGHLMVCTPVEFCQRGKSAKTGFARFRFEPKALQIEVAEMSKEVWDGLKDKRAVLRLKTVRNGPKGAKIVMADFHTIASLPLGLPNPPPYRGVRGPYGYMIPEQRFDDLTKNGCYHCHGFINPVFAEKMAWVQDKKLDRQPICHECSAVESILACHNVVRRPYSEEVVH